MNNQIKAWIFSGLAVFMLLFSGNMNAQNANEILDKAALAYEQSNGMSATFALNTRSEAQGYNESFEGLIQMRGDKFTLQTPDAHIWFDGKMQWVYMERNEEVNVSTPTGDELQMTNPTILLRTYKKGFNASYKGESTTNSAKTAYDIELSPRRKNEDIEKVTLQIEKKSGLPARITIQSKNGGSTSIQINEIKTGVNQPDSFFVFNEGQYPNAEVIDLR